MSQNIVGKMLGTKHSPLKANKLLQALRSPELLVLRCIIQRMKNSNTWIISFAIVNFSFNILKTKTYSESLDGVLGSLFAFVDINTKRFPRKIFCLMPAQVD